MRKILFIVLLIGVFLMSACSKGGDSSRDLEQSNATQETTSENITEALTTAQPTTEAVTTIIPTTIPETEEVISSQIPEEDNEIDYSMYLGTWSNVDANGQGFTVTFSSINGTSVDLYMCKVAPNAAHIAMTEKISAEITDGKVYFEFKDSFMNSGIGVLTLNGDTISISAEAKDVSQPFIYAFMGEAELVKTSDSTGIPYL